MSAPGTATRARRVPAADGPGFAGDPGPFGLLLDPALPRLAAALDPAGMARRFAEGFADRARGPAPCVLACEVEEVYYRPGRHCGILYRLQLNGGDAPVRDEWLYARMLPRELLRERYEKALGVVVAAGASALVRSSLDPVSLWDEPGMIVWTFPNDPKLPGLRAVADPARARGRLVRERSRLGLTAAAGRGRAGHGEPPEFERVKYMPTKRCVLRYQVANGHANGGAPAPFVFFAKAYPTGGSEAPFRLQRLALERLAAAHATVEIAEPLVHLPEESAIWFADWGGRGLVEAAGEQGWVRMAERAAAALAAFHRLALPGIPLHPSPAEDLAEARVDAARYAARVRGHAGIARGIVAGLERGLPRSGPERPAVVLHGAFRAEHVLVRGPHTAFIDLDGMALGDPLVDVAEFVASLEFLALRSEASPFDTECVSRRFLESYAASVPWAVDGGSLRWYALVSILRKLHGAVKRLARPTLDRLESRGATLARRWNGIEDWAPRAPRAPRGRARAGAARARPNGVAS
jgi:aminoglycoside phosphotransferase (APT) family kinase protein